MPRKLRLSVHRKNEFRKQRRRTVTVEHVCTTQFTSQSAPLNIHCVAQPSLCQTSTSALVPQSTSLPQTASLPVAEPVPDKLKVSIPREIMLDCEAPSVMKLQARMKALSVLPHGWLDTSDASAHPLQVLVLTRVETLNGIAQVLFSIHISNRFEWVVQIGTNKMESSRRLLSSLPQFITTVSSVLRVIEGIDSFSFCRGNEDEKYFSVQASRKGVLRDSTGSQVAATYVKDYFEFHTIRCVSCMLLVAPSVSRCDPCVTYRKVLNSMLSRSMNSRESDVQPDSHTNLRYLNTPKRKERFSRLRVRSKVCQQQVKRLTEKIEKLIEEKGMVVSDELNEDLVVTMDESAPEIIKQYPPGSFRRIFWEQQQRAASLKNSKSMKWEPAMIRWCLYLRHLSSSAYEVMRNTGVLRLPSQRTLRDYTYYTESAPGFSADVDKQLMDTADILNCPEREKYVIIIFDEMHVRENLVYNKHTGAIVGFTNLGEVNSLLSEYEKSFHSAEDIQDSFNGFEPLAKSVLVMMVRGLFSKLQFPYVQFPCSKLHGYELYDMFWEAVERLERSGFHVLGCTCDGLSVNRRFFKLHGIGSDKFTYKVLNPYSLEESYLFFFSDPPHLVKTVRNCWSSNKRLLWYDGDHIEWSHLMHLYHWCHSNTTSPGLTIAPKLKYEHLYLTSFSKMRVDLAAQVLSNSVGRALQTMKCPEFRQTIQFVLMFDKLFDCLNVSNFVAAKYTRNAFKAPFHSAEDFRIKWLKGDFLGYLDKWEESVNGRTGFTPRQKEKMMLSKPTLLGLRITVLAFVEMVEFIFTIPGVTVFLSNRICQDPLENFFGRQRQRGRVNENPSVAEFLKNTQALRVINSTCATVRGNCRGAAKGKEPQEVDNSALAKRKTRHM